MVKNIVVFVRELAEVLKMTLFLSESNAWLGSYMVVPLFNVAETLATNQNHSVSKSFIGTIRFYILKLRTLQRKNEQ